MKEVGESPELPVVAPKSAIGNARAKLESGVLRPPFDRAAMPGGISRLPVDPRGYPIPWFVDRAAPLKDGGPDFRIMDGHRLKLAIREKRCWVCGEPIRAPAESVFVAGPMCGINRTSAEPPLHSWCAEWSVRACPFLAMPKRLRDERGMPAGTVQAGVGITRNPGVTMLWSTAGYKTWKPPSGGVLFDIGDPKWPVEWFREGRAATRAEVMHSIETGLPLLLRQAALYGAEGCFELGRMTERFLAFLPDEDDGGEAVHTGSEAKRNTGRNTIQGAA